MGGEGVVPGLGLRTHFTLCYIAHREQGVKTEGRVFSSEVTYKAAASHWQLIMYDS